MATNSTARALPVDSALGARADLGAGRRVDVVIALVGLATLAAALILDVVSDKVVMPDGAALGGSCWSLEIFGVACPFCGMTRSVIAFAHGDLGLSLGFHPGGFLMAITMVGSAIGVAFLALTGGRPLASRPNYWRLVEGIALVCVALGVGRWLF